MNKTDKNICPHQNSALNFLSESLFKWPADQIVCRIYFYWAAFFLKPSVFLLQSGLVAFWGCCSVVWGCLYPTPWKTLSSSPVMGHLFPGFHLFLFVGLLPHPGRAHLLVVFWERAGTWGEKKIQYFTSVIFEISWMWETIFILPSHLKDKLVEWKILGLKIIFLKHFTRVLLSTREDGCFPYVSWDLYVLWISCLCLSLFFFFWVVIEVWVLLLGSGREGLLYLDWFCVILCPWQRASVLLWG